MLLKLLLALLIEDNYIKYRASVKIKQEERELETLYKYLDQLMELEQKTYTLQDFTLFVESHTTNIVILDLLASLADMSIDDLILEDALKTIKKKHLAYKLAELSLQVAEGLKETNELLNFVQNFEDLSHNSLDDIIISASDLSLSQRPQGLRWRLNSLNKALGSLRKSNFGFVFARPETGKTTFVADIASYCIDQIPENLTGPVVWVNNEEDGKIVYEKVLRSYYGITDEVYQHNPKNWIENFITDTKDRFIFVDSASISKSQVEMLLRQYKPKLLIVDQIDKIKGFKTDERNDLRLGAIYQWFREKAKEHCPVIGVCQADGSAEGKKWLTMDNVAESKTAKQAEADFIIGIGKTNTEGLSFIRHLNISKNKLPGDIDKDETMRHGKIDVIIEPHIVRYKDIT